MSDQEQSQQAFLHAAKAALDLTWEELAEQAGIQPRALKNYRMPDESQNHRRMPNLAWQAVQHLLDSRLSGKRKKVA